MPCRIIIMSWLTAALPGSYKINIVSPSASHRHTSKCLSNISVNRATNPIHPQIFQSLAGHGLTIPRNLHRASDTVRDSRVKYKTVCMRKPRVQISIYLWNHHQKKRREWGGEKKKKSNSALQMWGLFFVRIRMLGTSFSCTEGQSLPPRTVSAPIVLGSKLCLPWRWMLKVVHGSYAFHVLTYYGMPMLDPTCHSMPNDKASWNWSNSSCFSGLGCGQLLPRIIPRSIIDYSVHVRTKVHDCIWDVSSCIRVRTQFTEESSLRSAPSLLSMTEDVPALLTCKLEVIFTPAKYLVEMRYKVDLVILANFH